MARRARGTLAELERQRRIVATETERVKVLERKIGSLNAKGRRDERSERTHRLCEQHGLIEQYAGRPLTTDENATLAKIAHVLFACGEGDLGNAVNPGNEDKWLRACRFTRWIAEMGDVHFLETRGAGRPAKSPGGALCAAGPDGQERMMDDERTGNDIDLGEMVAGVGDHAGARRAARAIIDATGGALSGEAEVNDAEALLYRCVLTLLLDWFPSGDMTLENVWMLASMLFHEGPGGGSPDGTGHPKRSPLGLILRQVETGRKCVGRGDGDLGEAPSPLCRRDGVRPAEVGGLDPADDTTLGLWARLVATLRTTVSLSSLRKVCERRRESLVALGYLGTDEHEAGN